MSVEVDWVLKEAGLLAAENGICLGEGVVRTPRPFESDTGLFSDDFLVVDVGKIKKLSPANEFELRNAFSKQLLIKLGFMGTSAEISQRMEGAHGNLLVSFDHKTLPYKAEVLVHNMGCGQYFLSGFTISPK